MSDHNWRVAKLKMPKTRRGAVRRASAAHPGFPTWRLTVTLRMKLRRAAPGLTPRAVLQSLSAIAMVDVHIPTTDGRVLILPRYTEPEAEQQMILDKLHLQLPAQPPPRVRAADLPPARSEPVRRGQRGARSDRS